MASTLREHAMATLGTKGVLGLPACEAGADDPAHEAAAALVLADLLNLGGRLHVVGTDIFYTPPRSSDGNAAHLKARVKASLLCGRDRQMEDPSVRAFLMGMRSPLRRRGLPALVSIDAIVDDGNQLADALEHIASLPDASDRASRLKGIIDPVVQIATSDTFCPVTGHPTLAIWRYFRHTWSLEYRMTPGRMARFLIRNAARPGMPVMGIACLTNPVMRLPQRDTWIGWTRTSILTSIRSGSLPWQEFRADALRSLEDELGSIRWDDLLDVTELSGGRDIEARLRVVSEAEAGKREALLRTHAETNLGKAMPHKRLKDPDWKAASEEPLFRKKRAHVLADLLMALRVIRANEALDVTFKQGSEVEEAILVALHEMTKIAISSKVMDLNVCGAIEPYREILGGKLVALAMMSKEALDAYSARYSNQASEIASSMAGRPVVKSNEVCVLTTTSLYGSGSSQYNRLKIRIGEEDWRWQEIGRSEGFGTVHLSDETTDTLRQIAIKRKGMRHVNSRFGEGASPLLRQVRDGLKELGLPSDAILKHASQRIIYAAELYSGARRDLMLNRDAAPARPTMENITGAWIDRWVASRIQKPDVLARMRNQGAVSLAHDLGIMDNSPDALTPSTFQMELF